MITLKNKQAGLTMLEVIIASVILSVVVALGSYVVFTSSTNVSEAEIGIQLEAQARLVVTQIANDIRQCRSNTTGSGVAGLRDLSATPPAQPGLPTPVALLSTGMSGIQIRLPGSAFDNVNASMSTSQQGTWLTGLKGNSDAYTTRMVAYYWDIDTAVGETRNQADDNKDGRVDEGILRKVEWVTDAAGATVGNPIKSVICRDLAPIGIGAAIANPYTPASTANNVTSPCNWGLQFMVDNNTTPTKMTITLTLAKSDPKKKTYATNHLITKQVQATIELRN